MIVDDTYIDGSQLPPHNDVDGLERVLRNIQCLGQVVGSAERQEADGQASLNQGGSCGVQRAVAAADNDQVASLGLSDLLADGKVFPSGRFDYGYSALAELFNDRRVGFTPTAGAFIDQQKGCLLYTSPSPRDVEESRMPSSA